MAEKLEIKYEQPPIISEAREVFRLPEGAIFTWNPYIYNPSHAPIDQPLYEHESHHAEQQGDNPQKWWELYLKSPDFRLSQEVSAYQIQYRSAKEFTKDRNKLHGYLMRLAIDLSGPQYGDLLSFQDAYDAIKRKKLYNFAIKW